MKRLLLICLLANFAEIEFKIVFKRGIIKE